MHTPGQILQATVDAAKELLKDPTHAAQPSDAAQAVNATSAASAAKPEPTLVPVRVLGEEHKSRIAEHLIALDAHDRYLRFGYPARDEQILHYVAGIPFTRDAVYGIYNRNLQLIAMAHLAISAEPKTQGCAEFGVSVLKTDRSRGYGQHLFEHALRHAQNVGVHMLFIHALSENAAMLHIARKAGAKVESSGGDSEAHLLVPSATPGTRIAELVDTQVAEWDYHLKSQAKQFWGFLARLRAERDAHS